MYFGGKSILPVTNAMCDDSLEMLKTKNLSSWRTDNLKAANNVRVL